MSPSEGGALSYVLPIRWRGGEDLDELTGYLAAVARRADVIVVDGSPDDVFRAHHARWSGVVRHVRPHRDLRFASGKVNGVITGVREARHAHVVIADDDVRWDDDGLDRVAGLLDRADLVRPQNVFSPLPWHARWDMARSLVNRAVGGDFPGTLAVRRATFLGMGGYDGDVLFENLELMRTVAAAGGTVVTAPDLFVRRRPPTTRHFLSQRVRQAYDEFARPARMAAALAVLPALAATPGAARGRLAAGLALAAVGLAEAGRRRGGADAVVPAHVALLAPCWVLERSVCAWLAVASRVRFGGVRYGGVVLTRAANHPRTIRRRLAAR